MSFFAIQRDSLVKDILFSLPECHPEFVAIGVDVKATAATDITLEELCKEKNFDVDDFILYLRFRLDDLA